MFHATMSAAISGARTLASMDELSRLVWQAVGSGAVADDEAQALAEALHARRDAIRSSLEPVGIPSGHSSIFPPKRLQRAPERSEALSRRRRLAFSGPMPANMACGFTPGQLAVLRIVADEIAEKGVCGLFLDAVAARAGVCKRLAQAAIRLAEGDGLLTVQERRHEGRKNSTNLIRIISREWLAWIARGRKAKQAREERAARYWGDRVNPISPLGYGSFKQDTHRPGESKKGLPGTGCRHERKRSSANPGAR